MFPQLDALRSYDQFVLWKAVPNKKILGKFDKLPCDIKGFVADAHNPVIWLDADSAVEAAGLLDESYGVGFVFTSNDPFFFVDIDNALHDGEWNPIAVELCSLFAGAAIEVSHSNRGIHIIGSGNPSIGTEKRRKKAIDPITGLKDDLFDIYTEDRFVALTGTNITGDASFNCQTNLDSVVKKWLEHGPSELLEPGGAWSTTHVCGANPILDDTKLIAKAIQSKPKDIAALFGAESTKLSFKDLWANNVDALVVSYPHDSLDGEHDRSSADAALAQHLAFWTGGNCQRIESLMRQSALVRDKWDYHSSYMSRTIINAVGRQNGWYKLSNAKVPENNVITLEPVLREGYQLLAASQQIEMFKGCVYIAETNRIFCPNGSMLKPESFNALFGGYNFLVGDDGEKTTKKAWEAFTESQNVHFPKAESMMFRPDVEPGSIIEIDGWRYVNTYVPIDVRAVDGDISPFMTHLGKVLPDERDQTILLSYMSACLQYKGYKIQWAPLLQGVVGNGKSLFTWCLAYAIGERYTHLPPSLEISEKFNSWLFNTLFIGVEDIYVPSNKLDAIEALKPMITNKRLAKRAMNTDQQMHNICCNFIFNSNHKDAIKNATKDRRYCVFYTAQQEKADLLRDGMDGLYFSELYKWLDNRDGYAIVANFLNEYAIPDEFNPTKSCQTAPTTSSTAEAATVGMGRIEQEVLEAIEEGRTGFAGGWISSFAFSRLLKEIRKDNMLPLSRHRELLKSLGYDYHPALKDGRVNNYLPCDGGKPRLYIRNGHIHINLTSGAEVARLYAAEQGDLIAQVSAAN
jgi:hypothetical protein